MVELLSTLGANPNPNFNFNDYSNRIRAAIHRSRFIVNGKPELFIQMCPMPASLYGQIKLHKEGTPLRPVSAYYSDPSFLLAKTLAQWFKAYSGFTALYSVKNSIEIANKLHKSKFPPNSKIISFDVKAMYPRIPVKPAIDLMIKHLECNQVNPDIISEFRHLLENCLHDNIL